MTEPTFWIDSTKLEPIAAALFNLASLLEDAYPGLGAQHGWARITEVSDLAKALEAMQEATKPDGLQ
ncbi:MAG: hypothetical protein KME45_32810 [Stenomitos rutilans HA7619-LM2]|jgi:hypothetical protein|nr:hypothetical protein [Stenomitos rutilans HA7619-LM2]